MVIVTGGVHGDEPSGAAALAGLAATGLVTFGPCNPWGLEHGCRTLADGRDLNRAFADQYCVEAERVRAFLRAHPPTLLLDLHEDRASELPYLIQYGPTSNASPDIVEALRGYYTFAPRPRFGPIIGRRGVLRPSRFMLALVGLSRRWPMVYWTWRTFGCPAIVVEVPGRWPLEERLAFHHAVAHAAR